MADILFPFPQTLGKHPGEALTQNVNTWAGWPFRPTRIDPVSIGVTGEYAANNWYGSPYAQVNSEKAQKQQAAVQDAKASGGIVASGVSFLQTAVEEAQKAKSWTDQLFSTWDLKQYETHPGAIVAGSPPAPTTVHYQPENPGEATKEKLSKIQEAGDVAA